MNDNSPFERLNDYLDGELSPEEAAAFEAELDSDPALRAEAQAMRALIADAARLPKGIAPQRDLWAAIDAQLVARAPRNRTYVRFAQGLLAVAAAAAIFVAGFWFARNTDSTITPVPAPQQVAGNDPTKTTEEPNAAPPVQFAGYAEITAEYASARTSLRAALEEARPNLAPETILVIDDSLAVIDRAISDIQTALDKDPGNRSLMQSLVAVYNQEVGLLRQVTVLAEGPRESEA